jgi:very-short-patch-repair endonuclease
MTDAEHALWRILRNRQFVQTKFRRQVPIGPYIADFVCYQARLIIEADGGQHSESRHDAVRDAWFAAQGFRVLRFWNNDILQNPEGVATAITMALSEREPLTRPLCGHPLPSRLAASAPWRVGNSWMARVRERAHASLALKDVISASGYGGERVETPEQS